MITAVITTYKRAPEMVKRAVKSVINQTYKNWKLVIVDDSPSDYELRDSVRKMIEEWHEKDNRISYVQHEKNYGACKARNTGLDIALKNGSEFVAFLDDDDEWLPEKLEKQLARFTEKNKDTALVYCSADIMDDFNGYMLRRKRTGILRDEGNVYKKMILGDFIGTCSKPLIRTKCLEAVGGFDEKILVRDDWDTWLRIAERYEFVCVDEPLMIYHANHGEHLSSNMLKHSEALERIIGKHINYLKNNNYPYWKILMALVAAYAESGEYKKFISTWAKAVSLQPSQVKANFRAIFCILFPYRQYRKFKRWLLVKHPQLFTWLKSRKYRMKGAIYEPVHKNPTKSLL